MPKRQVWVWPSALNLGPPPLGELARSNFIDGIYRIDGVSKTASQLWTEDTVNWYSFNPATDIVPGLGLTYAGLMNTEGRGPVATPALLAALDLTCETGFSVRMDYDVYPGESDSDLDRNLAVGFELADLVDWSQYRGFRDGWAGPVGSDFPNGAGNLYDSVNNTSNEINFVTNVVGLKRAVVNVKNGAMSCSVNGGPVQSLPVTSTATSLNSFGLFASVRQCETQSRMTIRDVSFHPLIDLALLPAYSALGS